MTINSTTAQQRGRQRRSSQPPSISASLPLSTLPLADEVTPPAGAQADAWQDNNGQSYRTIYGAARGVADRPDISLSPAAVQFADGTVDNGDQLEPPVVYVEFDSERGLTASDAQALATALVDAAADLDRWLLLCKIAQ